MSLWLRTGWKQFAIFENTHRQRLHVAVADDEAGFGLLGGPGRGSRAASPNLGDFDCHAAVRHEPRGADIPGRAARGSTKRKATCGSAPPVLNQAVQGCRPAPPGAYDALKGERHRRSTEPPAQRLLPKAVAKEQAGRVREDTDRLRRGHTRRPMGLSADGRQSAVIVATLSRLTRDTRFLLALLDGNVEVVFADLPQVPPGAMGRFFLTQMVAVAELEAGLVSERTKAALAAAKRKGTKLGNPNLAKASVSGVTSIRRNALGERFQSSNHMGCLKRPHSVDGKPKMQLSGFMESVV